MFNAMMKDIKIIENLGGPRGVVEKLGIPLCNANLQIVRNWKVRGIPAKWKLARPDLFLPTKRSK